MVDRQLIRRLLRQRSMAQSVIARHQLIAPFNLESRPAFVPPILLSDLPEATASDTFVRDDAALAEFFALPEATQPATVAQPRTERPMPRATSRPNPLPQATYFSETTAAPETTLPKLPDATPFDDISESPASQVVTPDVFAQPRVPEVPPAAREPLVAAPPQSIQQPNQASAPTRVPEVSPAAHEPQPPISEQRTFTPRDAKQTAETPSHLAPQIELSGDPYVDMVRRVRAARAPQPLPKRPRIPLGQRLNEASDFNSQVDADIPVSRPNSVQPEQPQAAESLSAPEVQPVAIPQPNEVESQPIEEPITATPSRQRVQSADENADIQPGETIAFPAIPPELLPTNKDPQSLKPTTQSLPTTPQERVPIAEAQPAASQKVESQTAETLASAAKPANVSQPTPPQGRTSAVETRIDEIALSTPTTQSLEAQPAQLRVDSAPTELPDRIAPPVSPTPAQPMSIKEVAQATTMPAEQPSSQLQADRRIDPAPQAHTSLPGSEEVQQPSSVALPNVQDEQLPIQPIIEIPSLLSPKQQPASPPVGNTTLRETNPPAHEQAALAAPRLPSDATQQTPVIPESTPTVPQAGSERIEQPSPLRKPEMKQSQPGSSQRPLSEQPAPLTTETQNTSSEWATRLYKRAASGEEAAQPETPPQTSETAVAQPNDLTELGMPSVRLQTNAPDAAQPQISEMASTRPQASEPDAALPSEAAGTPAAWSTRLQQHERVASGEEDVTTQPQTSESLAAQPQISEIASTPLQVSEPATAQPNHLTELGTPSARLQTNAPVAAQPQVSEPATAQPNDLTELGTPSTPPRTSESAAAQTQISQMATAELNELTEPGTPSTPPKTSGPPAAQPNEAAGTPAAWLARLRQHERVASGEELVQPTTPPQASESAAAQPQASEPAAAQPSEATGTPAAWSARLRQHERVASGATEDVTPQPQTSESPAAQPQTSETASTPLQVSEPAAAQPNDITELGTPSTRLQTSAPVAAQPQVSEPATAQPNDLTELGTPSTRLQTSASAAAQPNEAARTPAAWSARLRQHERVASGEAAQSTIPPQASESAAAQLQASESAAAQLQSSETASTPPQASEPATAKPNEAAGTPATWSARLRQHERVTSGEETAQPTTRPRTSESAAAEPNEAAGTPAAWSARLRQHERVASGEAAQSTTPPQASESAAAQLQANETATAQPRTSETASTSLQVSEPATAQPSEAAGTPAAWSARLRQHERAASGEEAAQPTTRPQTSEPAVAEPSEAAGTPAAWSARLRRHEQPQAAPATPVQPTLQNGPQQSLVNPSALPAISPTPLRESTRRFLKPLVGFDPNTVPVVRGAQADQLAGAFGAQAMTDGRRIVLAATDSEVTPRTLGLLAHELTHIAQRAVQPDIQPNDEAAARTVGAQAAAVARQQHVQQWQAVAPTTQPDAAPVQNVGREPWGNLPAPWEPLPGLPKRTATNPTIAPPAVPAVRTILPTPDAAALVAPRPANPVQPFTQPIQRAEVGQIPDYEEANQPAPEARQPAPAEPDIDGLARQVYQVIKQRLAAERRRNQV